MSKILTAPELFNKLPATIRIGPFDWNLVHWTSIEATAASRYGECSSHELIIRISPDMASPAKLVDTFLHEIGHAIWWVSGLSKQDNSDEERIVSATAITMVQVFRDNPWLTRWIDRCLGTSK